MTSPMTTVHLPSILRSLTQEQASLQASGNTVAELIADMEQQYPGLAARLLDGERVQRFMNIYVGDTDIRFAQQLATPIKAGEEVLILTAVAGGSPAWQAWKA